MNPKKIAILTLALSCAAPAFGLKNLVQRRQERIEFAETQWTKPEKVTINIQYRVPVIEVLGYLAVTFEDMQKFNAIAADLRPIAQRVTELSGGTYEGRTFPPELEAETERMRNQMMDDVTRVYGANVTQNIEAFLKQKYHYLGGGIFGPLN